MRPHGVSRNLMLWSSDYTTRAGLLDDTGSKIVIMTLIAMYMEETDIWSPKLAHQNAVTGRREKRAIRKGTFLDWIYRFLPIPKLKHKTGHLTTPRFGLGPWIGARVASQRCPILRPGRTHHS